MIAKLIGDWLLAWQTLIAGVLALIGAVITVVALRRQSQQEAERRCRGTRAVLPATLDAVYDYATSIIRWLKSSKEKAGNLERGMYGNQSIATNTCPRLDAGAVAALRECVENLGIKESRYVSDLLSKLQVHQTRCGALQDYFDNHALYYSKRMGLVRSIDEEIAAAVEIAAYVGQLFPYARNETETVVDNIDLKTITSAFRVLHLSEINDVAAWNMATNRFLPKHPVSSP